MLTNATSYRQFMSAWRDRVIIISCPILPRRVIATCDVSRPTETLIRVMYVPGGAASTPTYYVNGVDVVVGTNYVPSFDEWIAFFDTLIV